MPRTRIFTARDRRALTAVLTAGLRHTDIDTIIHSHPVPGDPGHDAGKAGRVGLLTATLLARSDHTGLAQALTMADTTKVISAGHGPSLQRLRTKAEELLAPAAETPTPPGAPAVELGDTPAAEIEPQERSALPVLTLDGLEMDHPIVAILVDAGVQVLPSTDQAPAGHLVLSATPLPKNTTAQEGTSAPPTGLLHDEAPRTRRPPSAGPDPRRLPHRKARSC